ncbi:MAG: MFS transporter [Hyphomicrobiaceae bacterium]
MTADKPNRTRRQHSVAGATLSGDTTAGEDVQIPMSTTVMALGPFALGYFLSYLFRAVNAIIESDLVAEIGLGPAELGLVTAAYLGAFALFQLPLGVLLDRFGPRRVQFSLLTIGAIGALLFGLADDVVTLVIARSLIGLGFAGGLMASFKAVVIWVKEPRRALANAVVMSAGAIGLLLATAPMELATQAVGWRNVFLILAGITLSFGLVILFLVPERHAATRPAPIGRQIWELGGIFRDRAFLALGPLLATTAGSHIAIQTLWAGPWFRDVAGFDRDGVATYLLIMAVAFLVGILVTGAVADWLVRRGVGILTVMIVGVILFLFSQVGVVMNVTSAAMLPIWVVFGMLGQVIILAYPWLSSYFGAERSGRAQTAVNLLIFATAFAMQYAMGEMIELFPIGASGNYAPEAYQVAFGVALGLQILALLWYWANAGALRLPQSSDNIQPVAN